MLIGSAYQDTLFISRIPFKKFNQNRPAYKSPDMGKPGNTTIRSKRRDMCKIAIIKLKQEPQTKRNKSGHFYNADYYKKEKQN